VAQRVPELRVGPAADPGLRIGGNVRAVEDPERGRQGPPADVALAAVLLIGVTTVAACRGGEIRAARNGVGVRGRRGAERAKQQKQAGERRYFLISARNFW